MIKVKQKLYEHRFGLFFFAVMMCFGLGILDPMRIIDKNGVTYSFYCVDFSLGFCTKLLPGAIYNLLIGKYDETAITIYVKALVVIVFILISIIFERILKAAETAKRKEAFFFVCFAAVVVYFSFFRAGLAYLLDFHWIIAAVFFIIFLSNKKLYVFIPLALLYAVMTHYVSCICYVAICLLILLYKAYITEEKKEKYFLFGIFGISFAAALAIFAYMLFFELDNVKISYPQFMSLFSKRGVGQVDYYRFSFFRDVVEDIFQDYYSQENIGVITNIDMNQPLLKILYQTIVQQFEINAYLADHKSQLPQVFVFVPGLVMMLADIISRIRKAPVFEKLICLVGIGLFVFICVFSLVFSTDTIRWLSNAILTLSIFYFFVMSLGRKDGTNLRSVAADLPDALYYLYIAMCAVFSVI